MEESPPTEQMEFMCGRGSLLFQMRLSSGKFFTGADLESWEARMGLEMERELRCRAAIGRFADLNWFELLLDLIGSGTCKGGCDNIKKPEEYPLFYLILLLAPGEKLVEA